MSIFTNLIYDPVYNLLVFIYDFFSFSDFGIAIIILTILVKLALYPLSKKQIESQKKLQELQPKIKEIQNKYKNDKQKQSQALMAFYKENKANPLSGCLPLIVQLVFLIAIYRVLFNIAGNGFAVDTNHLYSFIKDPGQIDPMFLGLVDLSAKFQWAGMTLGGFVHLMIILLAALAQFYQSKMLMKKKKSASNKNQGGEMAEMMQKQMLYLGPFLTLFIGFKFPAGLALYWLVSTAFMIVQQKIIIKGEKDNQ